jgi:hypothetical protein
MAEIPIERKPRSKAGIVVLLLVLVIVAVGAWYWWSMSSTSPQTTGSLPDSVRVLHSALTTFTAELA